MKPQRRIRLNLRLLPILVGVLFLLDVLNPYDGWLILLVGLGGAWLASYLWARAMAANLEIRREVRFGWAQVGDRLEERFTLINHSVLPALWVEVKDLTTMPGYQVSRVASAGSHSQTQWRTEGFCTQRGMFTHGPTVLRTTDPLGIYSVEIQDPHATQLMVTPPVVPLPAIEVAAGGRAGEGRPRPDAPERTVSAATVRPYVPGDSLRWIHWRTTARRGSPYVRLFEGTPAGDWWIILDLQQGVQVGEGQTSTIEHGVILAASLADRGLRLGQTVGIVSNSAQLTWLPPQKGEGQRWQLLRALAMATPGERPFGELLLRMRPSFGKRASLILVTPNVHGEWIEQMIPLLWSGAVPTVLLLDPASYGQTEGDPQGEARGTLETLAGLGIQRYLITQDVLNRPEARPGRKGRWEWRVSPSGRAIRINKPQDESWKEFS